MQTRRGTDDLSGYLFALGAGALWGTTGPISTALYAEGTAIVGVGFWRVSVAAVCLAVGAILFARDLFRIDRVGLLAVGLGGGVMVALFEVAYQFAIAGAGVAGAAALLYTAPVIVTLLARPLLGEPWTLTRLLLAVGVAMGVAATVAGGEGAAGSLGTGIDLVTGVLGGLLAASAYAGTTLLARWAIPRYGMWRVLLYEIAGGASVLALVLPLAGSTPELPLGSGAWLYVLALGAGSVVLANLLFFSGLRRIEAAPAAVAATIEPIVGTVLALVLFGQHLSTIGWLGLGMVVLCVAAGYSTTHEPPHRRTSVADGSPARPDRA